MSIRNQQSSQVRSFRPAFMLIIVCASLQTACSQMNRVFLPRGHEVLPLSAQLSAENEANVRISMARSAEMRGDFDQAIASYHKALERDGDHPLAFYRLALLHDKLGDGQTAKTFYYDALARDPEVPEIHCDLGYSCYVQELWQEAEHHLREAIRLRPNYPRAHNNLATLLTRTARVDEALAEFARAGISEGEAHANLAIGMMMDGQVEAARYHVEYASHLQPATTSEQFVKLCGLMQNASAAVAARPAVRPASFDESPAGR